MLKRSFIDTTHKHENQQSLSTVFGYFLTSSAKAL